MGDIIELNAELPHTTTEAVCVCGKRWQAVFPTGVRALECPDCGKWCCPPFHADYLDDADFREKYEPLITNFCSWRHRLLLALGFDPGESMEKAVAEVERLHADI